MPRPFLCCCSRVAVAAALTTGAAAVAATPAAATSRTHVVHQGESIQEALDAARPGDRVDVRSGTYAEQLTIAKDRIELVGHGARLVEPAAATDNTCSGLAGPDTEAGICVTGRGVTLADFVVEHREVLDVRDPVSDVSISGFEVRGFSGPDIALVGARNARVSRNLLVDGARYGVITDGSRNSRIVANTVVGESALQFIGICMDDVTPPLISGNRVTGYDVGLCIQTQGAEVRDNDVSNGCIGAYIDPGIGAHVHDNHIGATNPVCPDLAQYGIHGIILDTAVGSTVTHNSIDHQTADGIRLVDAGPTGPFASHNLVARNVITGGHPDLYVHTAGSGNVVVRNRCTTSDPDGLCD
jgi:nitrous oxidase accessory protein NosD